MDLIREYILSVAVVGILCGIVRKLIDKKGIPGMLGKSLTGLAITITILSPLTNFSLGSLNKIKFEYQEVGEKAVRAGEEIMHEALGESISEYSETYIFNKAKEMGVQLEVEVYVSNDVYPVPKKVRISGSISPYVKKRLQQIIEEDLGVMEENQEWK